MISEATRNKMRESAIRRMEEYPQTKVAGWNRGLKGRHFSPKTEFKKGITPQNALVFVKAEIKFKGTNSEYKALHHRIGKLLGKPKKCSKCGESKKQRYEWANVSGNYLEVKSDWIRLCHKCHYIFDGADKRKERFT